MDIFETYQILYYPRIDLLPHSRLYVENIDHFDIILLVLAMLIFVDVFEQTHGMRYMVLWWFALVTISIEATPAIVVLQFYCCRIP